LKQTKKPERIKIMECYLINPFENMNCEVKIPKKKIA